MRFLALSSAAVLALVVSPSNAQPIDYAGYSWQVDRYEPDAFENAGDFMGRSNVLRVFIGPDGFAVNRPGGQSGSFYNFQGRKAVVNLPPSSFFTADLYIPAAWQAAVDGNESFNHTGLWASLDEPGTPSPDDFPILVFANNDAPGRFRIWDPQAGGWVDLAAGVDYGQWNTMRIEYHASQIDYYINGELVFSDTDFITQDIPGTVMKEIFINSYNNGEDPGDGYEAFYSAVIAGLLVNSEDVVGAAPAASMSGYFDFEAFGTFFDRRGLPIGSGFLMEETAWARIGGLGGDFDVDGLSFDGEAYFAQFGVDFFGNENWRFGVAGSVGQITTSADVPAGSNNNDADTYSIGVYGTYSDEVGYVDATIGYAIQEWSNSDPLGLTDSFDNNGFFASIEGGLDLPINDALTAIPYAQLYARDQNFGSVSNAGVNTQFDDGVAVFGRLGARLVFDLGDPETHESRIFGGVAVLSQLSSDTTAVVSGPALPAGSSTFSGDWGTSIELLGGFDLRVTENTQIFAQASYIGGDRVDAVEGVAGINVSW